MPWLLEIAMILSLVLQHDLEAVIIFVLLTINAIIGQFHSNSSQNLIELLKKNLAITSKVLRDKKWTHQDSKEIVPGDIISVKLGDIVAADAKLISGKISVDQSALKGESLAVEINESGIIYSGSYVKRGEALGVIINLQQIPFFVKCRVG